MSDNIRILLAKARADFQKNADFTKVKSDKLKYPYLPIEQAKPVIEEVTSKYGITIIPMDTEKLEDVTYDKKDNYGNTTKWRHREAKVKFVFLGPEESISMNIIGESDDNFDKGWSKCYTSAYKNMAKIVFGFSESAKDDPDATQTNEPEFVTGDQFVQESKVVIKDPKKLQEEAARNSKKSSLIGKIRWCCLADKTAADAVRHYLGENLNYDGTDDPEELAAAMKTMANIEVLEDLKSKLEAEGRSL